MKFKGTLIAAASGSVRGLTFSHNRGGQYIRGRTIPTNPGSVEQQAVRNVMSALTAAWKDTLTEEQRTAWTIWGDNSPRVNSLGDTFKMTGLQAYCANNAARLQAGLSRIDDAPATFGYTALTTPGITSITASTKVIVVTFSNSNDWATAVGGALLVYVSRPVSPTRGFFKGPFQYAGRINGAVSPPTSPQNITGVFPLEAGQLQYVRFVAVTSDGLISSPQVLSKSCV